MKKTEKFEVGKRVAEQSELITLTIEDGVAILRGEFTKADRKPLRYKKGAGWRYSVVDGVETWRLRIEPKVEPKVEPKAESATEPKPESAAKPSRKSGKKPSRKPKGAVKAGSFYVRWDGERPESFKVARSTKSSIWLVGADGNEFRKAVGESPERLSGGFFLVG